MVAIDFTRKIVLICGSSYAGEIKKSVHDAELLPASNMSIAFSRMLRASKSILAATMFSRPETHSTVSKVAFGCRIRATRCSPRGRFVPDRDVAGMLAEAR